MIPPIAVDLVLHGLVAFVGMLLIVSSRRDYALVFGAVLIVLAVFLFATHVEYPHHGTP
jgi:hypothetical protein